MERKQPVQMAKILILSLITLILLPCFDVLGYLPTQKIPLAVQMDYNNGTGPIKACRLNFTLWYGNGTLINKKYYGREIGPGLYENKTFKTNLSGDYLGVANCTMGTNIFYTRGFSFSIGDEDNMIITALILAPLIFGIILIIWTIALSEEHNILKMILQLGSFVTFWLAGYLGITALKKFYVFPEMNEALASAMTWVTYLFIAIVIYWVLYILFVTINSYKEQKKINAGG